MLYLDARQVAKDNSKPKYSYEVDKYCNMKGNKNVMKIWACMEKAFFSKLNFPQ